MQAANASLRTIASQRSVSSVFKERRIVIFAAAIGYHLATMTDWCQTLGIAKPSLEAVRNHPEANTFALFLVALLERCEPMTLAEVAERFEEAGIADREDALLSLQRCKPGRSPAYRDGERYHVDPHDHDLDLWT